jgi:hypothetical protein
MRGLKIRGLKWAALALVLSCLGVRIAAAESLEDRRLHASSEAELGHAAELTDRACGTHLKTGFDWSGFDPAQIASQNVVSWCTAALAAMEDICSESLGKEAVSAKVKALTCGGAPTPSVTLDGEGTVKFFFSLTPNQNKLLIRDYLNKNL